MKRTSVALFAVSLLAFNIFLAMAEAAAPDSSMAQIRARENDYTQGVRAKDVRLLQSVFAETFIDTSESGKIIGRREYLDRVKKDRSTIDSLKVDQIKIFVYGDAAIASSRFVAKGRDENGKPYLQSGRATDVWVKQGNNWMCVAAHSSPLQTNQ